MFINLNNSLIITKKNLLLIKRDPIKLFYVLYWVTLDIVLWGYSATWMNQSNDSKIKVLIVICSIAFWQTFLRSLFSFIMSFHEEIVSKNLSNIYSTPLKLSEQLFGISIYSLIMQTIISLYTVFLCYYIYNINILEIFGINFIYINILFYLASIGISILSSCVSILGGDRFYPALFMIGRGIGFFSAVFYPLDVIPLWAQKVASILPLPYIFEISKYYIENNIINYLLLYKAVTLSIIYIPISYICIKKSFNMAKINGLEKLYN